MPAVRERRSAKALMKGLDVLEALAADRCELTLADLARALELPKATAHRIVHALASRGYLERDSRTGAYRLGLRVWQLGCHVVNQLRLREVARPFLEQLATKTEEHVNLCILDGNEAVFIDIIESPKPVRPYTYLGGRVPAYCSATGKAMLAFQTEEVISGVLRKGLKPFTDRTIVEPRRLRGELHRIRSMGYAVNLEEWREDVCGLAAPVWNHENKVVGAVSITTLASRFDEQEFSSPVLAAARGISHALGYLEGEDSVNAGRETHGRGAMRHSGPVPQGRGVRARAVR